MTLSASVECHDLPLAAAFTIARGTTETATVHAVELADGDGHVGYGAAAPAAYYGETPASVDATLPDLLAAVERIGDPHAHQRLERRLREVAPEQAAARAAVSIAVHDLAARQREEPLFRRWGLDPAAAPPTSYTVGIDEPAAMADRAARIVGEGFPILKVKLGTADDRARLEAIRAAVPDATIRVDANAAWEAETAVAATGWLEELGVELLEQPVPAAEVDGLGRVRDATPIPVAADEACVTAGDVPAVADAADVVVIKLMKTGGLRGALAQIATARAHGLDAMLGCMVESNASIAAACHLAPLVDYVDLDGSLLLGGDPYDGVPLPGGEIALEAQAAGTGVQPA
jgi:L-alanine-DL-glutamate epimerase-like enolase superfamily enzyme